VVSAVMPIEDTAPNPQRGGCEVATAEMYAQLWRSAIALGTEPQQAGPTREKERYPKAKVHSRDTLQDRYIAGMVNNMPPTWKRRYGKCAAAGASARSSVSVRLSEGGVCGQLVGFRVQCTGQLVSLGGADALARAHRCCLQRCLPVRPPAPLEQ
jgi:hypothetical protein